jgi:hypothetical protein
MTETRPLADAAREMVLAAQQLEREADAHRRRTLLLREALYQLWSEVDDAADAARVHDVAAKDLREQARVLLSLSPSRESNTAAAAADTASKNDACGAGAVVTM